MCIHLLFSSSCSYFVNSFGCFFYWLIHLHPACCTTPRPLRPISMCLKSHLWTEEVGRKGRKGNGILLFVMGRGNMINYHSVCCTLHMALHWCMYREIIHSEQHRTKYVQIVTITIVPSIPNNLSTHSHQFWIMPSGLLPIKLCTWSQGILSHQHPSHICLTKRKHAMFTGLAGLHNRTTQ